MTDTKTPLKYGFYFDGGSAHSSEFDCYNAAVDAAMEYVDDADDFKKLRVGHWEKPKAGQYTPSLEDVCEVLTDRLENTLGDLLRTIAPQVLDEVLDYMREGAYDQYGYVVDEVSADFAVPREQARETLLAFLSRKLVVGVGVGICDEYEVGREFDAWADEHLYLDPETYVDGHRIPTRFWGDYWTEEMLNEKPAYAYLHFDLEKRVWRLAYGPSTFDAPTYTEARALAVKLYEERNPKDRTP